MSFAPSMTGLPDEKTLVLLPKLAGMDEAGLGLRRPVVVEFSYDHETERFLAALVEPSIAVFGYGPTRTEAVADLGSVLVDGMESLKDRRSRLSPTMARQLDALENLIGERRAPVQIRKIAPSCPSLIARAVPSFP